MSFPWDDVPNFHLKTDTEKMTFWIHWKEKNAETWQMLHTKWNFSDIDSSPWETYEISARIVESEWREKERKSSFGPEKIVVAVSGDRSCCCDASEI